MPRSPPKTRGSPRTTPRAARAARSTSGSRRRARPRSRRAAWPTGRSRVLGLCSLPRVYPARPPLFASYGPETSRGVNGHVSGTETARGRGPKKEKARQLCLAGGAQAGRRATLEQRWRYREDPLGLRCKRKKTASVLRTCGRRTRLKLANLNRRGPNSRRITPGGPKWSSSAAWSWSQPARSSAVAAPPVERPQQTASGDEGHESPRS